jgi:hypothetical protein
MKNSDSTQPGASVVTDPAADSVTGLDTSPAAPPEGKSDPLTRRESKMQEAIASKKVFDSDSTDAITHPNVTADPTPEENAGMGDPPTADKTPSVADPDVSSISTDPPIASDQKVVQDTAQAPTTTSPESPIFVKDGVQMVKLKVSGNVIERPLTDVVGIAQKNLLADRRLREATELQKAAQIRLTEIDARETALNARSTQLPTSSGAEVDKADIDSFSKDFIQALFRGTPEEAEAMVTKFQTRFSGAGIDTKALIAEAAEIARQEAKNALLSDKATQQQQALDADMQAGWSSLTTDFPEIVTDDVLYSMVDRLTEDLAQEHPEWKPSQVMAKAAETVASRVGLKKVSERTPAPAPASTAGDSPASTATPKPDTAALRHMRKVRLPQMPQALAGTRTPAKTAIVVDTSPAAVGKRMQEHRAALKGAGPIRK